MFTLLRSLSVQQMLLEQLPALAGAFVISEVFYKFHSFTLECLTFLATWFVIDAAVAYGIWFVRGGSRERR